MRIGTKLAITSIAAVLLVGLMIFLQMTGAADIRKVTLYAAGQQAIVSDSAATMAELRGMQMAVRDILLAGSEAELQKADEVFLRRKTSALKYAEEMARLSKSPENGQRIARIPVLIEAFDKGKGQLEVLRRRTIDLEAKRVAGDANPETAAQLSRFADQIAQIRKDVTLPINTETESNAEKIAEFARHRSVDARSAAEAEEASVERTLLSVGSGVALLLIASWIFSLFTVVRPIRALTVAMKELAGGNLGVVLPGLGRKDEVGGVADAVERFKLMSEQKARDETAAKVKQDELTAERRKAEMFKLADAFEGAVGEIIETVSSASTELEASAGTLTSTAERAQERATVVAAASGEASANVQSVASATEELSSSVSEISRQVQESARMASDAVGQAHVTTDRVSELSKAATRIGDVVELISTIAGQTNLLALNATIEAARAGGAGRGFAVVASEVKALAEQTAKATGEIGQQISSIQVATQESVKAIEQISGTIERLAEISSAIAAAVEEQGAATQEISRNVQQAAHGTEQVSANITDVQRGATETGSASSQVLGAARSLSGDSQRLKLEVANFLRTIRAA
ncbi:methyl-accepting chemotaxis protein [Bradyrhizobium sp. 6(2017)]|uniref:methyl-accepting chemotaxis protein n=1 Tax=Bradyrhizobium sp. 6(2017) TaxID=1197460 RepID=UPI0013E1F562|nr:methyl-accepting chemotaxis protein [Bradyrhizobium sp. 6(2017)]QIG99283.1 HAMP domain-containing protein [Bradyrhizobium sp. 6(2017)]